MTRKNQVTIPFVLSILAFVTSMAFALDARMDTNAAKTVDQSWKTDFSHRADLIGAVNSRLTELQDQVNTAEKDGARLQGDGASHLRSAVKEARAEIQDAKEELEDLRSAKASNWDKRKENMKADYDEAVTKTEAAVVLGG